MDRQEKALISIITPVFNGEKTIARTIESVLMQEAAPFEYIVIDGASTDKTAEIAGSYSGSFEEKGISYRVISEKDEGMYDALNKGVKLARGELVGSINADDWYEKNAVADVQEFYKREGCDVMWGNIRIHGAGRSYIKKAKKGLLWTTSGFCHPAMFCRRDIMLKYPYLNRHMDDDFDFVLRANRAGAHIAVLDKLLANYSLGGMSTRPSISNMRARIGMKYATYRRNGYSRLYWFYCVMIEAAKYIVR